MKRHKSSAGHPSLGDGGVSKENEHPNANARSQEPLKRKKPFSLNDSPIPPHDMDAERSEMLTQCRHCKWYNFFWHSNFTAKKRCFVTKAYVADIRPPSCMDWCHYCGRVASEKDLEKQQASFPPEDVLDGLTALGTKRIPFRILPHDPRKFDDFRENWRTDKSLEFNQAVLEEETFLHRIGKHPLLENVLKSIPVLEENRIPTNGVVRTRSLVQNPTQARVSADETYALLIDSRNHKHLLQELLAFGINTEQGSDRFFRGGANNFLTGTIEATFKKETGQGEFVVSLFAKGGAFVDHHTNVPLSSDASMARVFALFFDALPFRAAALTTAEANLTTVVQREYRNTKWTRVPVEPWKITADMIAEASPEEKWAVAEHNKAVLTRLRSNSFTSSTGDNCGGGLCEEDFSFYGTLRRFFSETLAEDAHAVISSRWSGEMFTWTMRKLGIVGFHRGMDLNCSGRYVDRSPHKFCAYLEEDDICLLRDNLGKDLCKVYERTRNFGGLMQQLENLGYPPAPPPCGLTVDLLNYQLQALNWAIQHENMEGGIQSFFWTKLPTSEESKEDLYFCPILDMLSRRPPKRVRGGFISLEMGLGKTLVSLALILQNPAPESPASGTVLSRDVQADGWTVDACADQDESKCGKIISRGTLVVVSVSLVGQWVEEAKSKLKEPGLVYSYYGSGRVKDPRKLAKNAILVTTYNTLASDASRSGNGGPLEKIRWWRVICDESHMLRNETSMSRSLMKIEAENRWAVTGTPINTSVKDLKNQLKFIGIEHVDKKFRRFEPLWTSHTERCSGYWNNNCVVSKHPFGSFLFFMRGIMMRHSIAMKNRSDGSDLIPLPVKTERVIHVVFTDEERGHYSKLEEKALKMYRSIRRNLSDVDRHYLFLLQALSPLRIACSGGSLHELIKDGDLNSKFSGPPYQMKADDQRECCICMENFDQPVATSCEPIPHVFCAECIEGVLGVLGDPSGPCPLCRKIVKSKNLRPAILPSPALIVQEVESDVAEETKEAGSPVFFFKSKLEVLIRELQEIRLTEPTAKSLVFSQFTTTLELLQEELPKHGFVYRTLSGSMAMQQRAKALKDFQSDPHTTIFLLSMKAGAVGINLTQANRVFLFEPALNPALEAQAIGRVHRLGQKNKIEVIRLVVENSIETRLLKKNGHSGTDASAAQESARLETERNHTDEETAMEDVARPSAAENDAMRLLAMMTSNSSSSSSSSSSNVNSANGGGGGERAPAVVGSLQSDKSSLKVEQFDELFGFKGWDGRWRP